MNNIDGSNLPSKRALATICEDLLQLLFPGFHDQRADPLAATSAASPRIAFTPSPSGSRRRSAKACASREPGCPEETRGARRAAVSGDHPARARSCCAPTWRRRFEGDPAAGSFDEIILAYPYLEAIAIQRSRAHALLPRGAAHPADDDGVGALPHRHRHPSRRAHRRALLHRSRHRRGHRRDLDHRRST